MCGFILLLFFSFRSATVIENTFDCSAFNSDSSLCNEVGWCVYDKIGKSCVKDVCLKRVDHAEDTCEASCYKSDTWVYCSANSDLNGCVASLFGRGVCSRIENGYFELCKNYSVAAGVYCGFADDICPLLSKEDCNLAPYCYAISESCVRDECSRGGILETPSTCPSECTARTLYYAPRFQLTFGLCANTEDNPNPNKCYSLSGFLNYNNNSACMAKVGCKAVEVTLTNYETRFFCSEDNESYPDCIDGVVATGRCVCGTVMCLADQTCSGGTCFESCVDGVEVNTKCACGTSVCDYFQFCTTANNSCEYNACIDGGVTARVCACGSSTCWSEDICTAATSTCFKKCVNNYLMDETCYCGTNTCAAYQYCTLATSTCTSKCPNNKEVEETCRCNQNTCSKGQFCTYSGTCKEITGCLDGVDAMEPCSCGSVSCSTGEICLLATGACMRNCLEIFDVSGTCKCGTAVCSPHQFCISANNTCLSQCTSDVAPTEGCRCRNNTCVVGQSCANPGGCTYFCNYSVAATRSCKCGVATCSEGQTCSTPNKCEDISSPACNSTDCAACGSSDACITAGCSWSTSTLLCSDPDGDGLEIPDSATLVGAQLVTLVALLVFVLMV